MLPRVMPRRKDGRSSFRQLTTYITNELNEVVSDIERPGFGNLTQYITREEVLNSLGENVEKTIAVETGNIVSLRTAATEMYYVASRNHRVKDPVVHIMISWPTDERPPAKDILSAARKCIEALGMLDHQYIIAVHANTDNLHAHIEINRVHPLTLESHHIEWSHKTLHRAAREIELEYGWKHDDGLYRVVEVDGKKLVVENVDYVEDKGLSGRAADFEAWSGEESLEGWCQGKPSEALQKALGEGAVGTWEDLHQVLNRFNLKLEDSGGGGFRVSTITEDGEIIQVAASKAFKRALSRPRLEEQLGAYQPRQNNEAPAAIEKRYKRDPEKRLRRRLERKELRDDLLARYRKDKAEIGAVRKRVATLVRDEVKQQRTLLQATHRRLRQQVREDARLSAQERQMAYSLLAHQRRRDYEALREHRVSRYDILAKELSSAPMVRSWREWVELQAEMGDPAAIAALKGIIYQEGRKRRKGEREEEALELVAPENNQDEQVLVRNFQTLQWHHQAGILVYHYEHGEPAFYDEGARISWRRKAVDDDSLRLALEFAREKWGASFRIKGGDEAFRERMVDMAIKMGIDIENPELRAYVAYRKELMKGSGGAGRTTVPVKETFEQRLAKDFPDLQQKAADQIGARNQRGELLRIDGEKAAVRVGRKVFVVPRDQLAEHVQEGRTVVIRGSGIDRGKGGK